ncbi:MAG TPA: hypothetical protein VNJ53_00060 [Gaiellaceae bacterium]|nr:hypothetical protein [Gaiellaceae bacterium]
MRPSSDTIVLTIPREERFRAVASLVLGGIGSRLDLPYERMDDLQLAVLSLLEAGTGSELSVEVERRTDGVAISVGPLAAGSAADTGLSRVVGRLVDGVEADVREDGEWVTLRLSTARESTAA